MKKFIFLAISAVMTLSSFGSCKMNNTEKAENVIFEQPTIENMLTSTTYDLKPLEGVDEQKIQWSTSNPSIIYVFEGTLYAVSAGEAMISATYNDSTQTYKAIAKLNNREQNLALSFCVGQNYQIAKEYVMPSFPNIDGITIEYESDAPSVVSLKNDTLTANAQGGAIVTAKVYENQTFICEKKIACCVGENAGIYTTLPSYELYIQDRVGETAFAKTLNLEYVVYQDGKVTSDLVTWQSGDESIATIDEQGVLQAVTVGETYIIGECTLENGSKIKTAKLPVKISIPVVQTNAMHIVQIQESLQFDSQEILSTTDSIGELKDAETGTVYSLSDNKVASRLFEKNEYRFIAYNEAKTYGYEANYILADCLVKTKQDLQNVQKDYTQGYVVLMNDLTDVGDFKNAVDSTYAAFSGTFNGLWHKVVGMTITGWQTGMFVRTVGATIKNIAFEELSLGGGSVGLFGYSMNNKIQITNVFIEFSFTDSTKSGCGGLCDVAYGAADIIMTNTIIIANNLDKAEKGKLSALSARPSGSFTFVNSYVITKGYLFCLTTSMAANQWNQADFVFEAKEDFALDRTLDSTLIDLSTYTEYWDTTQGVPVFR